MAADELLYRRTLTGDRLALAELVERYHSPLLGFLYRMTGHQQTAEDLVQETFVRLLTYHGTPPVNFRAWAFKIASNLARDDFRSARYRREDTNPFDDSDAGEVRPTTQENGPDLDTRLIHEADVEKISHALQQLHIEQREVLVLRFYHDMKLEEIAQVASMPLGTVKSRLFHALKRLKTLMESEVFSAYEETLDG